MRGARVRGWLAVLVVGSAVAAALGGVVVIAVWTMSPAFAGLDDED